MNSLWSGDDTENGFRKVGKGLINKPEQIVMAHEEGELELIDRKIWPYLLNRAYRDISYGRDSVHRVPVADVLKYLDPNGGLGSGVPLKRLNESLNRLASVDIVIDYVDEEGIKTSGRAHYLSYTMTEVENGWIHYSFDPFLLTFLSHPKVFATLSLAHLRNFRSESAARMYEIMALKVNMYYPYWQPSLDEFREKLNLNSSHQRWDNLKRLVENILDEVNTIAPFQVIMEEPQRSGKGGKITSLTFKAQTKGPGALIPLPTGLDKKLKGRRDPHTIDLLDGKTDDERVKSHAGISGQAIALAVDLLGPNRAVDAYIDQWSKSMLGRRVRDPDNSFLSWLDLKLSNEDDSKFSVIEEDTFAIMIEKWEGSR